MRTTVILKDDVLEQAVKMTGIKEKTELIHAGLKALIEKEARRRLIALGGSAPDFKPGRRRR